MSAIALPAAARSRGTGCRPATSATVRGLKGVRWAVRATLILGVAASVAANVLHAQPHLISQFIAAWSPVALLLTVELISRVPVHRRLLAAARLLATVTIAGIAAWVSYWHMAGVAARYGETGLSAYLLPISVDGLIVVASISLVELSARLQLAQSVPPEPRPASPPAPSAAEPPAATSSGTPRVTPANTAPVNDDTILDRLTPADLADRTSSDQHEAASDYEAARGRRPGPAEPPASDRDAGTDDEPQHLDDTGDLRGPVDDGRLRRPRGATRKAVVEAYLKDPTKHPTTIADEIGTSERSVRRYLEEFRVSAGTDAPNGANGAAHTYSGSSQ